MLKTWQTLSLKSLDIIICAGNGKLSKRIKRFNRLLGIKGQASEVTHTALVQTLDNEVVCVYESTTLNKWAGKRGVQLNLMSDWLPNYNGRVWVRRLTIDRSGSFEEEFNKFVHANMSKPYENGIPGCIELLACGLKINVAANMKNVHCSELTFAGYQYMEQCSKSLYANNFPPHTFWLFGQFEGLIKGGIMSISEPVLIKD